jgi:hypothetical protein
MSKWYAVTFSALSTSARKLGLPGLCSSLLVLYTCRANSIGDGYCNFKKRIINQSFTLVCIYMEKSGLPHPERFI